VNILTSGKVAVGKMADFQKATSSSITPISTAGDPNDLSLQSKLFHDLYTISEHKKGTKMLFNIQLAALHLSFMLKGFKENPELDLVRYSELFFVYAQSLRRLCLTYLAQCRTLKPCDFYSINIPSRLIAVLHFQVCCRLS
jgi:hypothetical protein